MRIQIIAQTADGQQISFGSTTVSTDKPYLDLIGYLSEQWEAKSVAEFRAKEQQ